MNSKSALHASLARAATFSADIEQRGLPLFDRSMMAHPMQVHDREAAPVDHLHEQKEIIQIQRTSPSSSNHWDAGFGF
ncbi:hypothetical protein [Bradyrhizobium sp. Ai1a-2]|uniref:hypothetical protein n=1 Tax=Bradyrhizobium sp. Ai1a-2 TaxID=196490 RepID=UPI0012696AD7|nr:hypothetical protein [Bradyrhizobium sp. Ai1a-2]